MAKAKGHIVSSASRAVQREAPSHAREPMTSSVPNMEAKSQGQNIPHEKAEETPESVSVHSVLEEHLSASQVGDLV